MMKMLNFSVNLYTVAFQYYKMIATKKSYVKDMLIFMYM